jgi:hypothetical protein
VGRRRDERRRDERSGLWLGELAVFDATVAAVPFLWDLAVTETVTCRPAVLELLRSILEHGNAGQIDVQYAAHLAVLDGTSTVNALSRDEDPAVKAAADELAASMADHACGTCRPA